MDFLALYITAKLTHSVIRPTRLALSSALGAAYALASVLLEPHLNGGVTILISVGASILCAFLMAMCAFGGKTDNTVRTALTYGAVNVGLGGIMTAIYSFIGRACDALGIRAVGTAPDSSPILFIAITLVSGAVSLLYGRIRVMSMNRRHVTACITAFGRPLEVTLLCDSGNLLRDPFGGKPVVILGAESAEGILPSEILAAARSPEKFCMLTEPPAGGIRLIPASGVAGSSMLVGFTPECVSVEGREIDAVIAIDACGREYDGCGGIISPEVLAV